MQTNEIITEAKDYIGFHWEDIVRDIASLVIIESTEDLEHAKEGAPWGPGPKMALKEALEIADDMGMTTTDAEGYIGWADVEGADDYTLGIIGHVDVVPAGPGWNFLPFSLARKDGYLIGRGVTDDKGPLIVALHAVKFWMDKVEQLPHNIRIIFGCNEETGMGDLAYYLEHYPEPDFTFTPDAEFPVCHGEKGLFGGFLQSDLLPKDAIILSLNAGASFNAVPGVAVATVRGDVDATLADDDIELERLDDNTTRITCHGKSAHASTPELGESAILKLIDVLLTLDALSEQECTFLELDKSFVSTWNGSNADIAAEDEFFGPLTIVGGTLDLVDGRLIQSLDARVPNSVDMETLQRTIEAKAQAINGSFELSRAIPPFLMNPESDSIQALLSAFNEVTGMDAKPFTMGGATYAREFKNAASFGAEMPWIETPDWIGGMHGPDEGVAEEQLAQSFIIYVVAIGKLLGLL